MTGAVPGPDVLARARVLAAPDVEASVVRALEGITGRPVERASGTAPDGPFVYVGGALPDAPRAGRLVWFHSVNAGTDALLAAGPWPEGALLTRTVGRMGERIAQYVLGWMLAECQSVPEHTAQHARAEWQRLPSSLVAGQTAVVHGTGRIGSAVAALLRACSVRTVGVRRTPGDAPGFDRVVAAGSAQEAEELAAARWVVSTLPLTGATEGFFGAERFAALRGASFVNVGRGASVDLDALEAALRDGRVRRAVLDVLPEEPPGPGDRVWRLPRTVVTSHSAGITADEDVVTDFEACWEAVARGRTPALAVDTGRGY
ncbi:MULTISPECIES: NAD(P)-dependent oxidoreductase [Streptomyces]|uniref:NAD(P)-dependent oxidoreductase n=1 Tax=Streptomyces TaxID=1883 RepID=UPI00081B09CA|nr:MULTISPECIES: NAD(P)-dependent oxidoreductase [unclassified Streptomyces]MYQ54334.1 D-2-hydroxyacid dehydrogenase [Streptomyces sp. SID4941]SCE21792.1 Phosphoglycerate dehydrogenase [Streptomyces sp. PalvLS-984]SDC83287.1 Phosphoglycerate dehydrogenase [Streptomyces sp. AmelKG-A3]